MRVIVYAFIFMVSLAQGSELLPKKVHRSLQSTAFMNDPYLGFSVLTNDHLVGTLAADVPIMGFGEHQDEVLANTQVSFVTRYGGPTIYAESLDVKISLRWERTLANTLHLNAAFLHVSGHVMDDVKEAYLMPLNMGSDSVQLRIVEDGANPFRYGASLRGFLGNEPTGRAFIGGVFGEYYFSNTTDGSFYLGQGVELPESLRVGLSTNSVLGYSVKSMRIVVGYYQGADLRLKHQLYLRSKFNTGYAGVRFDLD